MHFQHLSLRRVGARARRRPSALGARVSAEVTPHHLTLTDDVVRTLDSRFKMNPPLRTERDRRALIEALRSGVIDSIATDHAPHARHEKEVPFEQAPMGTTGLETAFAALYTELVLPGALELEVIVERLSGGGALYGLPIPHDARRASRRTSRWSTSARASRSAPTGYASRSANCCFQGRTLHGRVELTLAAGRLAFRRRRDRPRRGRVGARR